MDKLMEVSERIVLDRDEVIKIVKDHLMARKAAGRKELDSMEVVLTGSGMLFTGTDSTVDSLVI